MGIKIYQLQKRDSYEYRHIQDKYAYADKNKCCALADGTTQSFYSELWAELITTAFVEDPVFDTRRLIEKLAKSASTFRERPFEFSQNPAKASLEREKQKKGGTATFIGLKMDLDGQASVICCGDSNVFIVKNSHFSSFPYSTVAELDANTTFLNTEKLSSGEVDDSFFVKKKFQIDKGNKIILASDALSRLLLKNPDTIQQLLHLSNFDAFLDFCQSRWNDKSLEEDDITAIVIEDTDLDSADKIIPPPGFSFPKKPEPAFVVPPGTPVPNILNPSNQGTMQESQTLVDQLQREILRLKKGLRVNALLLAVLLALGILNTFLLFYLRSPDTSETVLPATTIPKPVQKTVTPSNNQLPKQQQKEKPNSADTIESESLLIKKPAAEKQTAVSPARKDQEPALPIVKPK